MTTTTALLISNYAGLRHARQNQHRWSYFLAGHHQIESMMISMGLPVFSPRDIPDEVYIAVQDQVARVVTKVEPLMPKSDASLKALLLAQLVRLSQRYFLHKALLSKFSIQICSLNSSGISDSFWFTDSREPITRFPYTGAIGIPSDGYVLDFQSPSGRSSGVFTSTLPVKRVSINSFAAASGLKKRERGNITLFAKRQRSALTSTIALESIISDSDLLSALGPTIEATYKEYQHYRHAWLRSFSNNPPEEAWFNYIKNPRMAAAMASLNDLGVKTRFQSHGGMHVFGSLAQRTISKTLSSNYFNGFPSAQFIHPRGPLQEPPLLAHQHVVRENNRLAARMIGSANNRKNTRFRVAYVPSFIVWQDNFWGLANGCYETFDVAEYLLNLGAKLKGTEIRLRLRGSLDTHLKGSRRRIMTGIDGDSLSPKIKATENIADYSSGDYNELLEWADLVITEGITAVTYDALDKRKPVLGLVARAPIRGAFPAKHPSVLATRSRQALYTAHISNFSATEVALLADHHKGTPLTDSELRSYIYVARNT